MARKQPEPEPQVDPTAFLLNSVLAQFLLMHTKEIKYMCMFAYTFLHGTPRRICAITWFMYRCFSHIYLSFHMQGDKVFGKFHSSASPSYKFVRMVFQCTGGGTLVPIFINLVPVSLATDAYPIAIFASYLLHSYAPILRDVLAQSDLLKVRFCSGWM